MNTLTLLISMLILFYTVESLQRERSTGFAAIHDTTPIGALAILLGKCLTNVVLEAGPQIMRLLLDQSGPDYVANFNWIQAILTLSNNPPAVALSAPPDVPTTSSMSTFGRPDESFGKSASARRS